MTRGWCEFGVDPPNVHKVTIQSPLNRLQMGFYLQFDLELTLITGLEPWGVECLIVGLSCTTYHRAEILSFWEGVLKNS